MLSRGDEETQNLEQSFRSTAEPQVLPWTLIVVGLEKILAWDSDLGSCLFRQWAQRFLQGPPSRRHHHPCLRTGHHHDLHLQKLLPCGIKLRAAIAHWPDFQVILETGLQHFCGLAFLPAQGPHFLWLGFFFSVWSLPRKANPKAKAKDRHDEHKEGEQRQLLLT